MPYQRTSVEVNASVSADQRRLFVSSPSSTLPSTLAASLPLYASISSFASSTQLASRDGLHGGRGGGRGRAAAVPVLLRAVDPPTALGGLVRPRRRPVPADGAGLARHQGPSAPRARLRRFILRAPAALLPRPPRRRPVSQLQVSSRFVLLLSVLPVSEAP